MTVELRLLSEARREFFGSVSWYDRQRRGLGTRFSTAVRKVFDSLLQSRVQWPQIAPGVHQAPVPHWPFVVIYQIEGSFVNVVSVFHTSRDPQEWLDRI